jgi:hypothetical protein
VASLGLGYSVEHEPSAIARAILQILKHPAEGCAMGGRGKEWARETFGWDAIGRSMRDAYQLALDANRSLA